MKRFLIALILFFAVPVFAANTVNLTDKKNCIVITVLDADYTASTDSDTAPALHDGYLLVYAIEFIPSATDDRLIVRDGGIDATEFCDFGKHADVYDTRITPWFDPPLKVNPVIDITDCTLGTAADAKVIIYIKPPRP